MGKLAIMISSYEAIEILSSMLQYLDKEHFEDMLKAYYEINSNIERDIVACLEDVCCDGIENAGVLFFALLDTVKLDIIKDFDLDYILENEIEIDDNYLCARISVSENVVEHMKSYDEDLAQKYLDLDFFSTY